MNLIQLHFFVFFHRCFLAHHCIDRRFPKCLPPQSNYPQSPCTIQGQVVVIEENLGHDGYLYTARIVYLSQTQPDRSICAGVSRTHPGRKWNNDLIKQVKEQGLIRVE